MRTPRQLEAIEALRQHGSAEKAAQSMGLSRQGLSGLLINAKLTAEEKAQLYKGAALSVSRARDPAVDDAMKAVGTGIVPNGMWIKQKPTDDAPGYSVYIKPQEQAPEDVAERIRSALEGMAPAEPVQVPAQVNDDLLTIIPVADLHVGLMAWGKETGEDYDTTIATDRLREWVGRAVDASPASSECIILGMGDLTHADDQTNQTPRSKHVLDVDTRHFRTLEMTIAAVAYSIEYALLKHARVMVRIIPGNHDLHAYMAVMFALAERYRNEPRVTVQKVPGEFFVHRFGDCLISAHHGHGGKPERMVLFLADEYASDWGQTRHRFLFTGHLHHHKSADIGGVTWEQLRAVTARDAYAVGNAYTARAQLQAITLHRSKGEVQRAKVAA